jgi:hypothetical protein
MREDETMKKRERKDRNKRLKSFSDVAVTWVVALGLVVGCVLSIVGSRP